MFDQSDHTDVVIAWKLSLFMNENEQNFMKIVARQKEMNQFRLQKFSNLN